MAGDKQDGDTGTPAAQEESGAGYGNNAQTDDVGRAGEDKDEDGDKASGKPGD